MSVSGQDRFWVGRPKNSKILWVFDGECPHDNPNMVYLYCVKSSTMKEYEKSFVKSRMRTADDFEKKRAIASYLAWHEKNGEEFLQQDRERVRSEMAICAKKIETQQAATIVRHKNYLVKLGISYEGVQPLDVNKHRATNCYACRSHLDSSINLQCAACKWLICECGACGCGYGH